MRRPTITLVIIASCAYYAVLFLSTGFIPRNLSPPPYLLALPLVVLLLILVSDLSYRATLPSEPKASRPQPGRTIREVQDLTKKLDVGFTASTAYYDEVLRSQLRELLVEKVSIETSASRQFVRDNLSDSRRGPGLLGDEELYNLLYGAIPPEGPARIRAMEQTVLLLELWKP